VLLYIAITHVEKQLWIVCDHTINLLADAPLHPLLVVDGPHEQVAMWPRLAAYRFDEAVPGRADEGLLEHVEVHVGLLQEVGSAYIGEADEGDGKAGEDLTANAEVAILLMSSGALVSDPKDQEQVGGSYTPGAQDYPLFPGAGGWDGGNGGGYAGEQVMAVIVKLCGPTLVTQVGPDCPWEDAHLDI